jgi:hypothetical protein
VAGYTKEFLIDAYLWRFMKIPSIDIEKLLSLERIAHKTYDTYGKDKFRDYASLDAEYIRNYKASLYNE